ncbi:MAG: PKD domain-containing protein, partial [bacterium]
GLSDSDTLTVTVLNATPPVAEAGPDQTVNEDISVTFDGSGSTDDVGIVSYAWNFGDGGTGSGIIVSHTYSEPGTYTVTLTVTDGAGLSDSDTLTVTVLNVEPVAIYQITSDVLSAGTTESFKLTIELVDPTTLPSTVITEANNPFIITACTASGGDAPGNWIKIRGLLQLTNGRAEIWVSYDTVGKIRFRVSDDLGGEPAYTKVIDITPVGLRYDLEAPERVQAGREFSLRVRLIDTGAGNLVTPSEYDRQVELVAYSSNPVGTPDPEGELKIKSFYLQDGEKTVLERYNLAHTIYIEASDSAFVTGRTADIEVIGGPKTALKLDGIYNERIDGIYTRSTTRVIIMSLSDIVADKILYRDKGSDWKTYVEPFTLSPGRHIIEYYGIDKYENKERINRSKTIYVSFFGGGVINVPNPFKAGKEDTLIEYDLKEPSNVTITIYDLFGQEVWHESYAAGENGGREANQVSWDGRNLSGKVVANGGYICRVWIEREKRHMLGKIAVAK